MFRRSWKVCETLVCTSYCGSRHKFVHQCLGPSSKHDGLLLIFETNSRLLLVWWLLLFWMSAVKAWVSSISSHVAIFRALPGQRAGCRFCRDAGHPEPTGSACRQRWSGLTGRASCRTKSCPMGRTWINLKKESEEQRGAMWKKFDKEWNREEEQNIKVRSFRTEESLLLLHKPVNKI